MMKYRDILLFQVHKQLEAWLAQEGPVSHEELYRFVHSLRGTAGTIGLADLSALSQSLLEQLDHQDEKAWQTHEWRDFLQELIPLCYEHRPEQEIRLEDPTLPQESSYEHQPLLLILDDDATLLMYLKEYLEKQNWSVIATVYPHKALDYFHDLTPDCLILDLHIPETGGFQVMQTLSEKIKRQYVPTTIISVDCERDTRLRAFRMGADDIMCKPLDLEELTARLERQLRRKRWMDKILFLDELTGVFNRNSLADTYQKLLADALRNHQSFSLAFLDIDHFKKVNDTYGHLVGDSVLSRFAAFVQSSSEKQDVFFRYGGEEFILLMPRTSVQDAKLRLERMLRDFCALPFEAAEGTFFLSFSAGVVQIDDAQKPLSYWIDAADTALYSAKNAGRCRIEAAVSSTPPDTRTVKLKVAIIEDDPLVCTVLADSARASLGGWIHTDIRTFHEGAAFFASSWHQGPEAYLVILDGILPHMDGLEVLQHIRNLPNGPQYRVLMLTGHSDKLHMARALQLGADDYMTKPFRTKELEARIKRLAKGMM